MKSEKSHFFSICSRAYDCTHRKLKLMLFAFEYIYFLPLFSCHPINDQGRRSRLFRSVGTQRGLKRVEKRRRFFRNEIAYIHSMFWFFLCNKHILQQNLCSWIFFPFMAALWRFLARAVCPTTKYYTIQNKKWKAERKKSFWRKGRESETLAIIYRDGRFKFRERLQWKRRHIHCTAVPLTCWVRTLQGELTGHALHLVQGSFGKFFHSVSIYTKENNGPQGPETRQKIFISHSFWYILHTT